MVLGWNLGTGTSCKENFQTEFVVAVGGFLSYWTHQIIKFEEEKRFGLYNFVIMKREI